MVSKLISYTFHAEKRKGKERGRGDQQEQEGRDDDRDGETRGGGEEGGK